MLKVRTKGMDVPKTPRIYSEAHWVQFLFPAFMSLFPPGGPGLPEFRSLLVSGCIHATAPIHLCLSLLRKSPPSAQAIIVTPSASKFAESLSSFSEAWFSQYALTGETALLMSRIRILSPETPAELAVILSELHIVKDRIQVPSPLSKNTVLSSSPVLLVLHDVSSYFFPTPVVKHEWTAAPYINLIIKSLALQRIVADTNPEFRLAVVENGLDQLNLPLVSNDDADDPRLHDTHSLVALLTKYFEKTIHISHLGSLASSGSGGDLESESEDGESFSFESRDQAGFSLLSLKWRVRKSDSRLSKLTRKEAVFEFD
ncbi:hypothetical protein DL96DRAFT_922274 [Flagelloscypha sp. PMI_526]|nr:hypothetical protein DL96DRAFT_922274 [Flagelloscypha sp. PMI_526]